jgi:hypothetical protein
LSRFSEKAYIEPNAGFMANDGKRCGDGAAIATGLAGHLTTEQGRHFFQ